MLDIDEYESSLKGVDDTSDWMEIFITRICFLDPFLDDNRLLCDLWLIGTT